MASLLKSKVVVGHFSLAVSGERRRAQCGSRDLLRQGSFVLLRRDQRLPRVRKGLLRKRSSVERGKFFTSLAPHATMIVSEIPPRPPRRLGRVHFIRNADSGIGSRAKESNTAAKPARERHLFVTRQLQRPALCYSIQSGSVKAFLLAILLSFVHSAFAVIGETEAEMEKRYGAPLLPPEFLGPIKTLVYQDGPIVVVAKFEKGICSAAGFSRLDRAPLSAEEIFNLLKANNGGQPWGTPPRSLAPAFWNGDRATSARVSLSIACRNARCSLALRRFLIERRNCSAE